MRGSNGQAAAHRGPTPRPGSVRRCPSALLAAPVGAATLCAALLCAGSARAFDGLGAAPPRHQIYLRSLTAAQWNPLGLQTDLFAGYRYRLVDSDSLLLRNTYAGAMAITRINPAFVRLGGGLELQPAAVATLRLLYEHRLYFGSVNMLQSFSSPYDEYHEDAIKQRGEAGLNYAGHGSQVTLQAVLRAKVGPVALLDDFNLVYFDMDLEGDDRVFYVNLFDTLSPGRGLTFVNHAHLLYLTPFRLVLGVRYSLVHAQYPTDWLSSAQGGNVNTPNHRIGPIVAYSFRSSSPYFSQPMVVLILNFWINNRYRSGQRIDQAVPYGVLAFQFSGTLWSSP